MNKRHYISVYFDDEKPLLKAVRRLQENNEIILDVLTPFPIHGLDRMLAMKRSRIPVGGFIFGAMGAILAFAFQTWVFTVSYPLIIGGKPFFAVPSFIPITFEVTVLFAGLAMAAALLIKSGLKPDIRFEPPDDRISDDMFIILVDAENERTTPEKVRSALSDIETVEIR